MKIEINYFNTKLNTEVKKEVKVKDLLQDLKYHLKEENQNFILYDNNNCKLKETDVIPFSKNNEIVKLFLIKSSLNNLANNINNEILNINEMIMKCTGAKKPIEKKVGANLQNRLNFLEFLGRRERDNDIRFGGLLDLLLDENNIFQIGNRNPSTMDDDNRQIEADEKLLRELQDMGFPEDRARQALITSRNNNNRATEILLGEN